MARRGWLVGVSAMVVFVALLAPAASASKLRCTIGCTFNLALLPLQKAQLGRVASSLSLEHDSGALSYAPFWLSSTGIGLTSSALAEDGWLSGYTLDYGDAFSGCRCITEIRTSVEWYSTEADARKGLRFWRNDDEQVLHLDKPGFAVPGHRLLRVPAVGASRFAYFWQYRTARAKPVWLLDERFTDRRYVLQVEISSGTDVNGMPLVSKLAKKLDKRLHLALRGRLHGRVAKLPRQLTVGPPSGGPDLSTLALQPSDLAPGAATLLGQGYTPNEFALPPLSDYARGYKPAGRYAELGQEIKWYPSANEAAFRAAFDEALSTAISASNGTEGSIRSVNLDSIGHGERATILRVPVDGENGRTWYYLALIALSRGQAADNVSAYSQSPIQPSDVQTLAQSMATRLDAAVNG